MSSMKVDVYPNITNVEVYENPISVPVEATWEKVVFTVPDPVVTTFDLGRKIATDRDGDYVIQVHYNSTVAKFGEDFRVDGTNVVWISPIDLAADEQIVVWYSPKSAYGSVPGSGEVTSLTHLNDVTIEGPLAGQMLIRNDDGQFVNKYLTAGANVTITSTGDAVTIASAGGGGGNVVSASTITEGTVRLSTLAESAGNSNALAITPAGLQSQLGNLSTVATSGQYADLAGKPALANVATSGQYADLAGTPNLSAVATSNDYNDLDNRPPVPVSLDDLNDVNLSGTLSAGEVLRYNGSEFVDSNLASTDLSDSADLARLASPSLTGNPTAPTQVAGDNTTKIATTEFVTTAVSNVGGSSGNSGILNVSDGAGGFSAVTWEVSNNHLLPTANDVYDIGSANKKVRDIYVGANSLKIGDNNTPLSVDANGNLNFGANQVLTDVALADVATSGQYADLTGAPTLSTVATSGQYADLTGAPTLSNVATSGQYADLTGAPTLSNVATSGSYADLSNKPTIPSASTDLTDTATLLRTTDTGTNIGDLVTLSDVSGSAGLPSVDASQLTGITATQVGALSDITNESIGSLSNVSLSGTLTAGEVLRYDGSAFVDSTLASTDLSDSADLARLASPAFTGNPTSTTPSIGDDSTKIATTAYVQAEIVNLGGVNSLNDLSDVSLSGTLSTGEVLRYDGSDFVDSTLASTDLSDSADLIRTGDVGTSSSQNVGTSTGDVVQLVDVSGSAGLPSVDASQLTGITATQVGALSDITNESLNSLTDVDYSAGATIDGYVLTYNHTNTQWEALASNGSSTATIISASTSLVGNTNYVVEASTSGAITLNVPYNTQPGTKIQITNLSANVVRINAGHQNVLYYQDGTAVPYTAPIGYYVSVESRTVIQLTQTNAATDRGDWYIQFQQTIEHESVPQEGDGTAYSARKKAYINAGHSYGDYLVTGDITSGVGLYAARKYVTAFNETTNRTINIGNPYYHLPMVESLDGSRVFFENRGSANLVLSADSGPYVSGIYHQTYFFNFDNTGQSSSKTLLPGESAVIEFEYDTTTNASIKMFRLKYQLLGHIPSRVVETDNSGTNTTITSGTEHQKVFNVDNGVNAVTLTLPEGASLRSGYLLDLKVLGSGAVTVQRAGSETIDADTSLTLSQYQTLRLISASTGWSILQKDAGATVTTLTDSSDVNASSPTDGQVLTWVGSANEWQALTPTSTNQMSVVKLHTGSSPLNAYNSSINYTQTDTTRNLTFKFAPGFLAESNTVYYFTGSDSSFGDHKIGRLYLPQTASEGDTIVFTVLEDASSGIPQYQRWGIYEYRTVADAVSNTGLPLEIFALSQNSTFTLYYDSNTSSWVYEDQDTLYKPVYIDDPSSGSVSSIDFSSELTGSPDFGLKDLFDRTSTSTTLFVELERWMGQVKQGTTQKIITTPGKNITIAVNTGGSGSKAFILNPEYDGTNTQYIQTYTTSNHNGVIEIAVFRNDSNIPRYKISGITESTHTSEIKTLLTNDNISLDPHGSGKVIVKGNATRGSGSLTLNCEQNSHGVTVKGPAHSANATYTLTLPDALGNANDVLQTDASGNLSWVAQGGGGGGGLTLPIVTEQNTSVTLSAPASAVLEEIYTINSASAVTLTLPSSVSQNMGEGFKYQFKRLGSGVVTIQCAVNEFIDYSGQTSFVINGQYDSITLVANNTSPNASWLLI